MRIAVIAHIRHAIARPFMGGMESHAFTLVQALERRGHQVTLLAADGSDAHALFPICAEPYEAVYPWAVWRGTPELDAYQRSAFSTAWRHILHNSFDMVHNNSLFPPLMDWARRDAVPMVTSQHVPPFARMKEAVDRALDDGRQHVTVTSHAQVPLWSAAPPNNLHVVHNGIDLDRWPVAAQRGDRLLWYGRITENKGLREAVAAAVRAGVALDIIGAIEDAAYFARAVTPWLGANIRYWGHLSGAALRDRVAQARAVVVTPMWEEPFGLVAAEALACGVPVIAFDRGALREVVGDCGLIVPPANVAALAQAMRQDVTALAPRCRERAAALFSIDRMIDGYEHCYRRAMEGAAVSAEAMKPSASASSCARTAALLA